MSPTLHVRIGKNGVWCEPHAGVSAANGSDAKMTDNQGVEK